MTLSDSRCGRCLASSVAGATPRHRGSPPLPASPFLRAVPITPADRTGACVDCFPIHAAFPISLAGRRPHLHFRGLLRLHSRYGPLDRSATQGDLCHEASARSVTRRAARQLPDQSTSIWVDSSSTGVTRPFGAHSDIRDSSSTVDRLIPDFASAPSGVRLDNISFLR